MHTATLHKVGESVIMAVPPAVLHALNLRTGGVVGVEAKRGHIHLVAPAPLGPLATRLEEFAKLQDGWLDGKEGRVLDAGKLKELAGLFALYFSSALPRPHLYPTPEGGVQAEWTFGRWEAELEIELADFSAQYFACHMETGEQHELLVSLTDVQSWSQLNRELNSLKEKAA